MLVTVLGCLCSLVRTRRDLALENLALRQQLVVLRRARPRRLRLKRADRIFWAWLSHIWARWAEVLVIVRPDTVVRWHRRGFRLFWRCKSRQQGPRSPVDVQGAAFPRQRPSPPNRSLPGTRGILRRGDHARVGDALYVLWRFARQKHSWSPRRSEPSSRGNRRFPQATRRREV